MCTCISDASEIPGETAVPAWALCLHCTSQRLVESIKLQLRFRTQERLTQLKATAQVAELYGEGIVPQDRMSVDAALANYYRRQLSANIYCRVIHC